MAAASFKLSTASNSHFVNEAVGDVLLFGSNNVLIGSTPGEAPALAVGSNSIEVSGMMASHSVVTSNIHATVITLSMDGMSLGGGGGGGNQQPALIIDRTDASPLNALANTNVLSNVRRDPFATPLWAASIVGPEVTELFAGTLDAQGNVFVGGQSKSEAVLYDASRVASSFSLPSGYGGFLAKFSPSGDPLHAIKTTITVWSMGAHAGTDTVYAATFDGLVHAYNASDYSLKWTAGISSTAPLIAVDQSDGSVYALVKADGAPPTVTDAGGVPSSGLAFGAASGGVYIVKYDSNGTSLWGASIAIGAVNVNGLKVDVSGNVYIAGTYQGSAPPVIYDASGAPSPASMFVPNATAGFVVKFSPAGTAAWATGMDGNTRSYNTTWSVDVDTDGNVYGVGSYGAVATVYDHSGVASAAVTLPSMPSGYGAYMVKWNAEGVAQWAVMIDNSNGQFPSVDGAGNPYLVGVYEYEYGSTGTPVVYNADHSVADVPGMRPFPGGGTTSYVVKYTPNGSALWGVVTESYGFQVGENSYNSVYIYSVLHEAEGSIVVCGYLYTPLLAYDSAGVLQAGVTTSSVHSPGAYVMRLDASGRIAPYKLLSTLTAENDGLVKTLINLSSTDAATVNVRDAGDATTLKSVSVPTSGSAQVAWMSGAWY